MAVIPSEGLVKAPFDGTVTMVFDTLHALALTSDDGVEVLIHIGVNTVELKGEPYKALVKEGQHVSRGTPLMEFDMESIREKGYDLTTPVLVTNSADYENVACEKTGEIGYGEPVIRIS